MDNIFEILKDKPKGTKLYSPIFGECFLDHTTKSNGEIWIKYKSTFQFFDKYGRHYKEGECLLFPSKEARDWSVFRLKTKLEPFEKVLVRNSPDGIWMPNFFALIEKEQKNYPYRCIHSSFRYCIPYEGNEHLLGTTNEPK